MWINVARERGELHARSGWLMVANVSPQYNPIVC
jgi:hypothetical protein